MQDIPLPWQIVISVSVIAGTVALLVVLGRAGRHGDLGRQRNRRSL